MAGFLRIASRGPEHPGRAALAFLLGRALAHDRVFTF